jgi:acyl-CoA thioester hydrolase
MIPKTFIWPLRVYAEDTDTFGFVYHANYLKYAERCRTELLYALGFNLSEMMEKEGFMFVVKQVKIIHHKTAKYGDVIHIHAGLNSMAGARCDIHQRFFVGDDLVAVSDIEVICVNKNGQPIRWPLIMRERLKDYEIKKAA